MSGIIIADITIDSVAASPGVDKQWWARTAKQSTTQPCSNRLTPTPISIEAIRTLPIRRLIEPIESSYDRPYPYQTGLVLFNEIES